MKNKILMLADSVHRVSKSVIIGFAMGCMMVGAMSIPVFAAESVKDVYISIVPDDDDEFSPGVIEAGFEPTTDSNKYYIDEYDTSSSNYTPRKSYTYTMDILPESGYAFNSNTRIIVYGATEVTIKSISSSKIEVKAKTYPFYVLDEPTNIVIDEAKKEATWDKVDYAKKYNVAVKYTNKNGDEKETKKSVTKAEIDLSGYIGKYVDISISVQAVKGTTDGDKFLSNSDYMLSNGTVDNDLSEEEYTFSVPTTTSDGSSVSSNTSSNSSSGSSSLSNGSSGKEGWNGSGDNWYYIKDGKRVAGWLGINGEWYLMDSNGNMKYGWQKVDGDWYYLNTAHNGSFGKMLSGWQQINGKWYYLNTSHNGTYGAMYANRTTPDGYKVGSDGSWIQ